MESLGAIGMPPLRKSRYDIESILLLLLAISAFTVCAELQPFWIKRNLLAHTTMVFPIWYKSVLPCQVYKFPCQVYAISLLFWILLGGSIQTCMSQEKVWCFQSILLSCLLAHDDSIQLARKLFFHLHTAQHKEQPAQHKETDFSVLLWSMIKGCDCKNVKRDQQTQRVHTPTTQ
jgi:hypothetical protein